MVQGVEKTMVFTWRRFVGLWVLLEPSDVRVPLPQQIK